MAVPATKHTVSQIYRLQIYLWDSVLNRSATERFNFELATLDSTGSGTVATLSQAQTAATKICGYRRALLNGQAVLQYARISIAKSTQAAFPLFTTPKLGIPITGESSPGDGDDSGTTLQFRLQTASGKHNVRQFGFHRDDAVTASALNSITLSNFNCASPPAISGDGTGQADLETAYKAWMSVLQQMTFRAKKISGGFEVEPWSCVTFLRPSSKKLKLHYVL